MDIGKMTDAQLTEHLTAVGEEARRRARQVEDERAAAQDFDIDEIKAGMTDADKLRARTSIAKSLRELGF